MNKRSVTRKNYGKGKRFKKYHRSKIPKDLKPIVCYCPQVCPDIMRVQLKYNAQKDLDGGGLDSITEVLFRGNGIYDPDAATGGNQPLGFDQWMALYNEFRVIASKCDVKFINDTSVIANGYVVANTDSTALSARAQAQEQQFQKSVCLGVDTNQGIGEISYYMPTSVAFGSPSDIIRYEGNFSGTASADPTSQFLWHIGAVGYGSSANNFSVVADITITYYVEFFNRKQLSRS